MNFVNKFFYMDDDTLTMIFITNLVNIHTCHIKIILCRKDICTNSLVCLLTF